MKHLDELIEITNRLSQRLEDLANDEIRFCVQLQIRLEQMSWELYRTANELKHIRDYI